MREWCSASVSSHILYANLFASSAQKLLAPGYFLHPLDLQLYVDMTPLDSDDWKVLKVWYNSQLFDSIADFRQAWEDGTLKKSDKPDIKDVDWSTRKRTGKLRDLDEKAGPRQVSVSGDAYAARRCRG